MSKFSRFAPHSTLDVLDRLLFWTIRIAAVTFLFTVVGVTFIGTTLFAVWLVVIAAVIWFAAFVLRWMLHRFWR